MALRDDAIGGFDSILVRLGNSSQYDFFCEKIFQFSVLSTTFQAGQTFRLQADSRLLITDCQPFRFHTGSIKRLIPTPRPTTPTIVSIPYWFD